MAETRIGRLRCSAVTYLPHYRSVGVHFERRTDIGLLYFFQVRLWWWEIWVCHSEKAESDG